MWPEGLPQGYLVLINHAGIRSWQFFYFNWILQPSVQLGKARPGEPPWFPGTHPAGACSSLTHKAAAPVIEAPIEEALQHKSSLVCSFLRKFIDLEPSLPTWVSGNRVFAFFLRYFTLCVLSPH